MRLRQALERALADGTRYDDRIHVEPGQPFDKRDAQDIARALQLRVDAGWDPRVPVDVISTADTVIANLKDHMAKAGLNRRTRIPRIRP